MSEAASASTPAATRSCAPPVSVTTCRSCACLAEHGDRARDPGGVVGEAHEPHGDRAQHGLGRERADPRGVLRGRLPALVAHGADELLQQEDVALGHPPAGVAERLVGAVQRRGDHPPCAVARQRRRAHGLARGVRGDLREQVVRRAGLAEAAGDDERDRHLVQATQQVQDEAQRGTVGPVHVVDRDEHRAGLGEVGQQAKQPVRQRIEAVVARGAGPARRALEQRAGERGRAGQQPVVGLVVGAGEQRLEEPQHDPELKLALQGGGTGAQHGHAVLARARHGGLQQRALADAGVALDEQQLARAAARGHEHEVDGGERGVPLKQRCRARATSRCWRMPDQKTGEPP